MKIKLNKLFEDTMSLKERLGIGGIIKRLTAKSKNMIITKKKEEAIEDIDYEKSVHVK